MFQFAVISCNHPLAGLIDLWRLTEVDAACRRFATLGRDFKNELDFDRHAEGQAGDAEDDAAREHPSAEDLDEELRRPVGDLRMVPEVALSRDIDAELRHSGYLVEPAEVRVRRG